MTLHIICERDVGLFSMIQQVIANIPWALAENRTPVVMFGNRACYWTPNGYAGRTTVWEYYFDPLSREHPVAAIPDRLIEIIGNHRPSPFEVGYAIEDQAFVSAHFGDHPELSGKTLWIPYELEDPSPSLRQQAAKIITQFIRPRAYIESKVTDFFDENLHGQPLIGVHIRGTDAVSANEVRPHRLGSLKLSAYFAEIDRRLDEWPTAQVFVATDEASSLQAIRSRYGPRVVAYDSLRHETGETAGEGPTGWIMPAYIAADRNVAARNGEEAVIEYLLLSRCHHLVHNGSSLARTALLKMPEMPHLNTHFETTKSRAERGLRVPTGRIRMRARTNEAPEADHESTTSSVEPDVIARVRAEKARRKTARLRYVDRPRLAFVVQSFNRASNIDQLHRGIRALGDHELIVCDEGSLDGSREQWESRLVQPNDFLIMSNDLHEIRILDRGIRFSAAEIICIVQDDDHLSGDEEWLNMALHRFQTVPDLAILGGFMGFRSLEDPRARGGHSPGSRLWGQTSFEFVHHVNIGPYMVRRSAYEDLGGWAHSFSRAGDPGIGFDNELCLRAWMNGYKVGYSFVPFKGPPGQYPLDGGTVLFSGTSRRLNMRRNQRALMEQYAQALPTIDQLVREANARIGVPTLDPRESSEP